MSVVSGHVLTGTLSVYECKHSDEMKGMSMKELYEMTSTELRALAVQTRAEAETHSRVVTELTKRHNESRARIADVLRKGK